jgi:hypothetical protein
MAARWRIVTDGDRSSRPARFDPFADLRHDEPKSLGLSEIPDLGSGGRGERLALLHDIGDRNLRLLVTVLAAGMGRFGRHLEGISWLQREGRLTLYRKIKATFKDIAGLDDSMPGCVWRAIVTPGSISASAFIVT